MTYAAVDTAARAARASGDLLGRVGVALVKQAATRISAIATTDDQREYQVARAIIEGTAPTAWTTIVLEVLDINGVLANPTDAQIDTAVVTAWAYFIKSRS